MGTVERPTNPVDRAPTCPYARSADDSKDDSAVALQSPRQKLVEALTRAIAAAMAVGDLQVARVADEALGRLVEAPERSVAVVADLGAARAKKRSR